MVERSEALTFFSPLADNELIREIVIRTLRKLSFQVDAVPDGVAAVEAVRTNDYDLILMDVR